MTKATWKGKGLHFCIVVHHQRRSGQELRQGRNLEAGADAEAMEWGRLLLNGLLPPGLLNLFSYRIQVHKPRDGTTHHGLGLPPLIIT